MLRTKTDLKSRSQLTCNAMLCIFRLPGRRKREQISCENLFKHLNTPTQHTFTTMENAMGVDLLTLSYSMWHNKSMDFKRFSSNCQSSSKAYQTHTNQLNGFPSLLKLFFSITQLKSLSLWVCAFDALYTTFSTRNHFDCFDKFSIFLSSLSQSTRFPRKWTNKTNSLVSSRFYSRISSVVTVHGRSTKALDILLYELFVYVCNVCWLKVKLRLWYNTSDTYQHCALKRISSIHVCVEEEQQHQRFEVSLIVCFISVSLQVKF